MSVSQTKSFNSKNSSRILGGVFGFFVLSLVVVYGLITFESTVSATSDKVTVDGVTNTTQYLTSMVLYAPGNSNDTVELKYDADLNALRIKGAVNADALVIGDGMSSPGNAILGGEDNTAEAGVNNGLIIGGKANTLKRDSVNSVVIGGERNSLLKTHNVAVIASKNTTFPGAKGGTKENVLVIGGQGNKIQGSMIFVMGEGNNVADSESILMGKNINAGGKEKIFVWSPNGESFEPKLSSAFYVNSKKGIGLNTNDPQVRFDFGSAGAMKLANVRLNTDATGKCNPAWKGVMAYVQTGGVSGLCGCNGERWLPLTTDPLSHGVCVELQKSSCSGQKPNTRVITSEVALPRWNSESNNGDGEWQSVVWTYGGIPALSGSTKECGYECNLGFHPGVDNPSGWQMGGCKACTDIANKFAWKSAGTGDNNCDFSCKGSFKYQNASNGRSCSLCSTGKSVSEKQLTLAKKIGYDQAWYSPDDNQLIECRACTGKPANAFYTLLNGKDNTCPWSCDDGYVQRGNSCLKATWQKVKNGSVCKDSGKWKDSADFYIYQCKDTAGQVVNDHAICNARGAKPNDEQVATHDVNCNPPAWTEWSCTAPICNGAVTSAPVKCTRSCLDKAGIDHGPAACGGSATKTETQGCRVDGLCSNIAGQCLRGTVSGDNGNTGCGTQRSWTCLGANGGTSASCSVANSACPVNGKCGTIRKTCEKGTFQAGQSPETRYCLGQYGGTDDKSCKTVCNPGYVFENGKCVKWKSKCIGGLPENAIFYLGDDEDLTSDIQSSYSSKNTAAKCEYMCKSGFTLHNGACVKQESYHWECKEIEKTKIVTKTCLQNDYTSIGIGTVHIAGNDRLPTHYFEDYVKDWLTYHRGDYLLDWQETIPILYIPISYYAGSTSQSAIVNLTMDISNGVGTYKNVKGTFSVKLHTNADGSNTDSHISVEIGRESLKYGNFALGDIPCNSRDSCTITVTSAKIDIPPMLTPCNESSTVLTKKLVCISSYTNQEAFGCLTPTPEEINSCYPPEQCEIREDNKHDFLRDIRVSNGFRGIFYPEEGRYKVGQLIPFTVNSVWNEFGLGGGRDPWTGNKRGFYSMCIGKNTIDQEPLNKNGDQDFFLQDLE